MEWTDSFIIPLIQIIVYTVLIVGFGAGAVWICVYLFTKIYFFVKYGLLKKYDEKMVEDIVEMLQRGMDVIEFKRRLYFHNYSSMRRKEMLYIFKKIEKEFLKGGLP